MTFSDWYALYPRKKARKDAERAWNQMTADEQAQAVIALPKQIKEWQVQQTEKTFIPYPASWIRAGRYEDEFETTIEEKQPDWWRSEAGIAAEARRRGVGDARPGESMPAYLDRIRKAPVAA